MAQNGRQTFTRMVVVAEHKYDSHPCQSGSKTERTVAAVEQTHAAEQGYDISNKWWVLLPDDEKDYYAYKQERPGNT